MTISDLLMENAAMAAMVVDEHGKVIYINNTYLHMLGLCREEVVGKFIGDITPDSRTLIVLRTGKAIVGYNWTVGEHRMIACALPLIKNGAIVGCFAYSLYMDIWDAKDLVENLACELNMYKEEVRNLYSARYTFENIVGNSPAIKQVKYLAQHTALHPPVTVLITGESGTGKELFAHAIHRCSNRCSLPFVRVNCAAIPENLLEAELFGYTEGAFTGARKGGNPGKFELANGGTIFLDEIGEMSLSMQSKLLVVLQEKEFERLGDRQPTRVNVRVIAATNRDLETLVKQGAFREDLYYRLNVVRLEVPPLRNRTEDIPLLAQVIIKKLNACLKTVVNAVREDALALLCEYNWPGNIRELENVLQRAMLLADMEREQQIAPRHLAFMNDKFRYRCPLPSGTLKAVMEDYEKRYIARVLEDTGGDKIKAAQILGIDPSWLYKKIKKYGITMDAG